MNRNYRKENLKVLSLKSMKTIDFAADELLFSHVGKEIKKIVAYQISTGGKKLRSALAIISNRLLGSKNRNIFYPAAGLEILHNYSLIIDDIIDNSKLRRNKPTVWYKFGKSIAECIAIDYSAAIFQAANRSKKPALISGIFAKTMKAITDGEILDILFEQSGRENEPYIIKNGRKKITEGAYLKMVKQKTATLFQSCCEIGAICANAKKDKVEALKNYGLNLGIAFQIRDDILDIFGEKKKFGKEIGKDIEEGKGGNIVIIFALKELSNSNRKKLIEIIEKKRNNKKEIAEAVGLINKTEACEKAQHMGEKFIERAKKYLEVLPQNKWTKTLIGIADFVIKREK